jgi:uncharacterized delta-60 repeat protein
MLFRLFRKPRRKSPAGPGRFRPCLEALEDRTTPSSGGLLDPTFGSGGSTTTNFGMGESYTAVTVQPDGKILTAGRAFTPSASDGLFAVARYNPNGALDTGFGSGGLFAIDVGPSEHAKAVAVPPLTGGKILVAGDDGGSFAVIRLNPGGTLDTTFGPKSSKGKVTVKIGGRNGGINRGYSMAVQADGRFVLAGLTRNLGGPALGSLALARFNANGTLDTSFGSGGTVLTTIAVSASYGNPTLDHCVNVAVDSLGRVVASATTAGSNADFLVARFTASGTLDTSFGPAWTGVVTTDLLDGSYDEAGLARPRPNNGVTTPAAVVRSTSAGSLDGNFGLGGIATAGWSPTDPSWAKIRAMTIQSDGRILLAGQGNYGIPAGDGTFTGSDLQLLLMRFNPTGAPDTSFGSLGTGAVVTSFGPSYTTASAITLQADGRLVVAGRQFNDNTQVGNTFLARYLLSAPQIGSFTATPNPVTSGSPVTLTAGNVTDGNPGATVT